MGKPGKMRTFEQAKEWMKNIPRPEYEVGQYWYYVYLLPLIMGRKVYLCLITEVREDVIHYMYINEDNDMDYYFVPSYKNLFEYFAGVKTESE